MTPLQRQFSPWLRQRFIKDLTKRHPKAEVFVVGGAVRDALLGRAFKDTDLVVRNVSKPKLDALLKKHGRVNLVGKRFGVFKFKPKNWPAALREGRGENGNEIDIALPRTEHTLVGTGAYKDFKVNSKATLPIEDDLSRRDFTINAMAWSLTAVALVDPFNGQADLKKKIIRTVGDPKKRFAEDYSRMLRAVRFACQLNFTIEPKTRAAIKQLAKHINKTVNGQLIIPREVLATELTKALYANPVRAVELLDELGFIKLLMPELLKMKKCPQPRKWHAEGDVWKHTMLALGLLSSKRFAKEFPDAQSTPDLVWAVVFHDVGKPFTITFEDRIRFSGHDVKSAQIWRATADRLKLASAGVDVDGIEKLCAKHMLLATASITAMKQTTIERYFFNPLFPGDLLRMLMFADVSATIPPSGKPTYTNYRLLTNRIKALERSGKSRRVLPPPLVNGNDIQSAFGIAEGPRIGELLAVAREAQLSGKVKNKKEGLLFIRKMLK